MSTRTDALGDLYVEVTGTETVTESQDAAPSHDPIDGDEEDLDAVATAAAEDGLDDALGGLDAVDDNR